MENYSKLTDEIVTATYEELIDNATILTNFSPNVSRCKYCRDI